MSHYGLKDNGKRGRMMVVKDVQAVDNIVSQTITSTCREEPKQIGWNKRHAKGEAGPLGTIRPARDTGLDINPGTGTPSTPAGSQSVGQTSSSCDVPESRASQDTEKAATMPPTLEYAEICATSQTQHIFWSFKRKVKPFNQSVNYIFLFHYNKEMDTSLHVGIQLIFLNFPLSNTKWSVKINLEQTSIIPHLCTSDPCTSLSAPFSALQSNLLSSSK